MESYAAGIIPYHRFENKLYFLLGCEKSNNKWSGFVGKSEPSESILQTALREFNEETSLVFKDYLDYFYSRCSTIYPITEKTSSGKNVYLWFVECPSSIFFVDLDKLLVNQSFIDDKHFKEKTKLEWFTLEQISKKRNILYRLKQIIVKYF